MNRPRWILPVIVLSQFCCTSLWFAGNAVMNDLVAHFGLKASALGHLTSGVQFGFIVGTLIFAILTIADRYSPSKVFFASALLAATCNVSIVWMDKSLFSLLLLRFLTGFFLAGIYPVGMKIAADYFEKGLGKSLGFLVGALVLGTAFPHLLKGMTQTFTWQSVVTSTSILAVFGGSLMAVLVPDGPFRKPGQHIKFSAFLGIFQTKGLRSAAYGYFGHMWELYAFWAFVPIILKSYSAIHPDTTFNVPVLSFFIIAIGGIACVLGGFIAQTVGTERTAFLALTLSCTCCLVSPFAFSIATENLFVAFLLFWGMVVIADSPLFSTLVAQNAPAENKGTALTMVNCIGFAITIVSIQFLNILKESTDSNAVYMILALGPTLGLIGLTKKGH